MNDFKVRFKGIKSLEHSIVDGKHWAQLAFESDHLVTCEAFDDWFKRELGWLIAECETQSIDVHVGGGVHAVAGLPPEGMEFESPTDIVMIADDQIDPEWLYNVTRRLGDRLNAHSEFSARR